jgi:hypothetical protein
MVNTLLNIISDPLESRYHAKYEDSFQVMFATQDLNE